MAKGRRGGGYGLTNDPGSVTLKQVVEAVDGRLATAGCLVHGTKMSTGRSLSPPQDDGKIDRGDWCDFD